MMLPSWAVRYVGVPFVDGGADISGADCYGLVSLVLEEQTGTPLPMTVEEARASGWRLISIEDVAAGDVLLFEHPGGLTHVALMVTSGSYLETRPGKLSRITRLRHATGKVTAWRRD